MSPESWQTVNGQYQATNAALAQATMVAFYTDAESELVAQMLDPGFGQELDPRGGLKVASPPAASEEHYLGIGQTTLGLLDGQGQAPPAGMRPGDSDSIAATAYGPPTPSRYEDLIHSSAGEAGGFSLPGMQVRPQPEVDWGTATAGYSGTNSGAGYTGVSSHAYVSMIIIAGIHPGGAAARGAATAGRAISSTGGFVKAEGSIFKFSE